MEMKCQRAAREDMMNDTFMKEKPILPLLTSMAFPMVVSMLVNSFYNIVDSLFVAQINEKAMKPVKRSSLAEAMNGIN